MKFKVITLGCKVNSYESEYIIESLKKDGFIFSNTDEITDIVIVNTCSVTNNADAKSRKMINGIKKENKDAILIVCGCSSENNPDTYKNMNIDILLGTKNKSKIPVYLQEYLKSKKRIIHLDKNRNVEFDKMCVTEFNTHTRAFVKIEDGCDNFCSYCIIPFTRGKQRSKNYYDVISEIKNLVDNGHKEIVLTGIHTGAYSDSGKDFIDIINEISKFDNLKRIRLSSVEITELNAKFMNMLKNNDKFCNHLHIPLQSGSDEILKVMNRKYDLSYYENKIKEIRNIRPNINITTDIIVGHPYETDELFKCVLNFCQKIKFGKIHVFPYSLRTGTKSSNMPQVDSKIKKVRSQQLISLSNALENNYAKMFLNKEIDMLVEEVRDNKSIGFSSNYLKIVVYQKLKHNDIVKIKVTEVKDGYVIGNVKNNIVL